MKPIHRGRRATIAMACACALAAPATYAETLGQFLSQGQYNGVVRTYYFSRMYGAKAPNANAFALGGMFNYTTPTFWDGFGVGLSFFTASDVGTHGANPATTDTTLMGLAPNLNALGQAYVQYAIPHHLVIRAGDQEIHNPWINGGFGSRILESTYQGVTAEFSPVRRLHLYGLDITNWKSRTSSGYNNDNLYYPTPYGGDTLYGGETKLGIGAPPTTGTVAFGAQGTVAGLNAQLWYYNFNQFARMFYTNDIYTLKTGGAISPFLGGQYVRQTSSTSLLGNVNSRVEGAIAGIEIPHGTLSWGYDHVPLERGAYGSGSIVSPYTAGYATDPLYSTSMIRGMVELGPGSGWRAKFDYNLVRNKIHVGLAYGQYTTYLAGASHDVYADLIYTPGGRFKGLSIRDRVEVSEGKPNIGGRSFIYNRVMLGYAF